MFNTRTECVFVVFRQSNSRQWRGELKWFLRFSRFIPNFDCAVVRCRRKESLIIINWIHNSFMSNISPGFLKFIQIPLEDFSSLRSPTLCTTTIKFHVITPFDLQNSILVSYKWYSNSLWLVTLNIPNMNLPIKSSWSQILATRRDSTRVDLALMCSLQLYGFILLQTSIFLIDIVLQN